jgi:alpha-galactosidase
MGESARYDPLVADQRHFRRAFPMSSHRHQRSSMMIRRPIASIAILCAIASTSCAADVIHIATEHAHLVLGVENRHVTQLVFGSIDTAPAIAPTTGRRPPVPEDFYPTAGAGYIWEPAIQVVHADGNTSTELTYEKSTSTPIDANVTETRIELKDPQYPLLVTLCFKTYKNEDVIEQWTEIRHEESEPIILSRFASAAPAFPKAADCYLTQYNGKYKHEMTPSEEKLTPGIKILDSKLGSRAQYYINPSFFLSTKGPAAEDSGEVFGGTLAWSGSFQFAFEIQTETNRLRALCGMNPYDSAYRLAPAKVFRTPAMLWSYSATGKGQISRNFHRWARKYGLRDGNTPRPTGKPPTCTTTRTKTFHSSTGRNRSERNVSCWMMGGSGTIIPVIKTTRALAIGNLMSKSCRMALKRWRTKRSSEIFGLASGSSRRW